MSDYPIHRLCREPPAPWIGEGAFALWHFSEDPSLGRFEPRLPAARDPGVPPLVWAVDTRHAPLYWFPRDCPRACLWPVSTTSAEDRSRFFPAGEARVHVIEPEWLSRVSASTLYAYRLPLDAFEPSREAGGYWTSATTVEAIERLEVGDLVTRHAAAGITVRTDDALLSFWETVIASTVEFSGIRLRNAGF